MTTLAVRGTLRRWALGASLVLGLGIALSACGTSGTALAKQACTHVNRSIALLQASEEPSNLAESAQLKQKAYLELRKALPIASLAAYHDGQWQALMTTVSESNRVPETTLITALKAQCSVADSSTFQQSPPPSSIPPPAPVTTSP